jgi:arsenate reductase (glutaredoxin)
MTSDKSLTMYWLPHCTTCQKAVQYLEKKEIDVAKFRDIKTDPLDRKAIEQLAGLVGGVDELFSRRARKYRAMNLSERELSSEEMIQLMAEEYTFIKRPVVVRGERGIAGFTPKSYDGFFQKA